MEEQLSNSDIAEIIQLTGKLLDLHDIDTARAKMYVDSVFSLERMDEQIAGMSADEIAQIRVYGKILQKPILEILQTGTLQHLQELISKTPEGIFDIMQIKGLGIKKIKSLWHDLQIDSIASLRLACENGSIEKVKGFGKKTQDAILENIKFIESLKGKLRLDVGLALSEVILNELKKVYPESFEAAEAIYKENEISKLHFLVLKDGFGGIKLPNDLFFQNMQDSSPSVWRGYFKGSETPVTVEKVSTKDFVSKSLLRNSKEAHLGYTNASGETFFSFLSKNSFQTEQEAYQKFGFPYIIPEMRNGTSEWNLAINPSDIITWDGITGALHNHSTYSDGKHSLSEMAKACIYLNFQYFGIADHSQTATYARGLYPETVRKQHLEIDSLNATYTNFKILKGIESDILQDGSLDYEDDVLKTFDYVVASVHSVLSMDIEKATERLIKAIENPYTRILGHPTGRILLRRNGYPIHYKKVIDACASNGVILELNASPYRLDLDWTWIPYCLDKGVMISINPDAHSTDGLLDIKYGVQIARKAGLTKDMTLNAQPLSRVLEIFKK